MKRRITVEQLNELTEEQKDKLFRSWEPRLYDVCVNDFNFEEHVVTDQDKYVKDNPFKMYPLLDIGQLIELLQEKNCDIEYNYDFSLFMSRLIVDGNIYSNFELCDILWNVVKAVL